MKDNVIPLIGREGSKDLLTERLQAGARELLALALEEEVEAFIARHEEERLGSGQQRIVRNGYLPERSIQTGIGAVPVRAPRARDRGEDLAQPIRFSSSILPRYLRRSKSVEEMIPWLYLKGISTNAFGEALQALLGADASGLSSSSIARLKSQWEEECAKWRQSDLSKKRFVYWWADGIYCGIRGEDEKMCLLVIIGVTDSGKKELVALDDGYRESEASWAQLLRNLKDRGLAHGSKLAVGDGSLGFWKALASVFPETRQQRCWQHKTMNILDKFPKGLRGQVLEAIHQIWMAPTKEAALKAWDIFVRTYRDKYPKAVECLEKDKDSLLTFYDFPAEHWKSLRTTNPIESTFATVRHRASRAKGCVSRSTMLAFAFKLIESASKQWKRFIGFERLAQVITGIKFVNGVSEMELTDSEAKAA